METLPFIFDRFSNGSVSLFTFKGGRRVVVSVVNHKTELYVWEDVGLKSCGLGWC